MGLQRVRQNLASEQQQHHAHTMSGFLSGDKTCVSLGGEEMEWYPGMGRNHIFVEDREGAIIFYALYF